MVWFNIHCSHDDWCRTGTETPELVHDTLGSATSVTVVLSPLYYSSGPPLRAPGPKYNHVRKLLKLSTTRMKKCQCHSSSSVCESRFFYTAQKTHLIIKETSSLKLFSLETSILGYVITFIVSICLKEIYLVQREIFDCCY